MASRLLLTGLFCLLVAVLARFPTGSQPEHGAIRLSWRHVGARVKVEMSDEEFERLPSHMRPQDRVARTEALDIKAEQ